MNLIDNAFDTVRREDFVLPQDKIYADEDVPLPIGHGQTISQPSTVRKMLEWLDPQPGERILDVGSGSGWTTALLSRIVGPTGKIYALEIIPELSRTGKRNCQKIGITNVEFFVAGTKIGLPRHGPYDRILVSAAAEEMQEALWSQLRLGGKLVIPVRYTIHEMTKTTAGWNDVPHPGFVFVPLVIHQH
ncbi:MAG: protein-L-isoaspartate O-methyltransferase [Sedimentisphaerales bacterium]|nr:protein-L-isoaspartate O-methyltransferase [Sedimentisphaerales bacterium]